MLQKDSYYCYNLSCNVFDYFCLFLIIGITMPKTLFNPVLLYLWLPCYLISLFVLTSTAFLLWLLLPFPRFIASPLLFPLFYVTHPLYSCASNTDLYLLLLLCHCYLDSYPCLTVFLTPPFHSFPCAPFYSFPHSFPCSPVLQFSLAPLSHSFPCFPLSGSR